MNSNTSQDFQVPEPISRCAFLSVRKKSLRVVLANIAIGISIVIRITTVATISTITIITIIITITIIIIVITTMIAVLSSP